MIALDCQANANCCDGSHGVLVGSGVWDDTAVATAYASATALAKNHGELGWLLSGWAKNPG